MNYKLELNKQGAGPNIIFHIFLTYKLILNFLIDTLDILSSLFIFDSNLEHANVKMLPDGSDGSDVHAGTPTSTTPNTSDVDAKIF